MVLLRRVSLFLLLLSIFPVLSFAQWQNPTPDELKMTADPAAPGADAVYLYREETTNDSLHTHTVYVRLKILTAKGREEYGDVEIPYEGRLFHVSEIQGRTIHSDGTVVPFTGKPFDRVVEKTQNYKHVVKVFSMPDVQVGSILEYRYDLLYDDGLVVAPRWYIQGPLYVHKAHYFFIPFPHLDEIESKGGFAQIAYERLLPEGVEVQKDVVGRFTLDLKDIPAELSEHYLPPFPSLTYRVLFYYMGYRTIDEFWKEEGKNWSKRMDKYASPSKAMTEQIHETISGANMPESQLKALYDAVMKMDNTDFTREHTIEENKAQGFKTLNNAEEVFTQKRGSSDQLALLFIAMARAAGFKAYAMQVTNRNRDIFEKNYPDLSQLDDVIAIVELNGKEVFFDPGQRYCLFGALAWKHSQATGLRQTDHGTEIATTPDPSYKGNEVQRVANLTVDSSGKVQGSVRIFMTGQQGLFWRQGALETDEGEIRKEFEANLQRDVPAGIIVKTKNILNLNNPDQALMVLLDVSGAMGTATSKRIFLPSFFFQANKRPIFSQAKREGPVDLRYPYIAQDHVTISLPPGMKAESFPQNVSIPFQHFAVYTTQVTTGGNRVALVRTMALANVFYQTSEYPELKGFLDKVDANDKAQIVLDRNSSGGNGQ